MSKVHYVVRRSRMGRFNFTLISEAGRITGSVVVSTAGRTRADIESDVRDRIRHLAETFAGIAGPIMPGVDDTKLRKCGQAICNPLSAIIS
ncbi:hypothetical protein FV222_02060 [Methylobacterium sp. WL103]|uniref:hypothetical protein n=1 Tax=Methylobacterium sp. WL103 TaxID=2603891 RepID=UPI0011CA0EB8|nr:hypothetical protein [Methylobacterium sp. WL103]TXN07563.1 hypothetical protein FV222_02060 [Methylobacterium sp. WL103]